MKYCLVILFFFVFACKPQKVSLSNNLGIDSVKFTYLYSEALKNRMLGQTKLAKSQLLECLEVIPSSTASAYQLSEILINEGDYTGAKIYSDFCIEKVQNNEWYLLQRAQIAKKLNESDNYLHLYNRLVKLCPENLNYLFEYSLILFENKQFDKSLESLKQLEDEVGINEDISFLRNNINFAIKRFDAIQLELMKLRKAFPDSVKYSDMLAEFYLNSNQTEKALDVYKGILILEAENPYANIGVAWIYGNTSRQKMGYEYLLKSINNDLIPLDRRIKIADLYLDYKDKSLNDDSIESLFLIVINQKHENSYFINKYLKFLFDRKKFDLVINFAKSSINQFPENITSWEYLMNAQMLLGQNAELKQYSLKALEYFPNHAIVFFYNGYSNFALNLYNEAINYFEMGIDYVSGNLDLEKQFLIYLAESYHKILKDKQSDLYFDKYLKLDSANAFILNNYAFYLTQRGISINKALVLSRKSIEIEPYNSSFLDTYAWILFNLKDYEKSIGFIERAYKYGGNNNPVIVEHYGDILFKRNKIDDALERWKEAYSIDRNNKKLLEKINKTELGN